MSLSLQDSVTVLPQISEQYAKKLAKLGINNVKELLTHFPRYHKDYSETTPIAQLTQEDTYTIQAEVHSFNNVRLKGKKTLQKAILSDESGSIQASWFNQPFLEQAFQANQEYLFVGKTKYYRGNLSFHPQNFDPIIPGREQVHLGRLTPTYQLTAGISPKWMRNRLKWLTDKVQDIKELEAITDQLKVIKQELSKLQQDIYTALHQAHFPDTQAQLQTATAYLSLLELINLQLQVIAQNQSKQQLKAPKLNLASNHLTNFINSLPFELTQDQEASISDILQDLQKSQPMTRLLQGDVGSGKTIVAVIAAVVAAASDYQVVVLAPTTILAKQHYQNFQKEIEQFNQQTGHKLDVTLVTGEQKTESKSDVLIGTSAILARKQNLIENLGLIIVDEQHRFGVKQREELLQPLAESMQQQAPHLLAMTATPIPRTLALALFSDLQVSTINSKPAGRKPIATRLVPEDKRSASHQWLQAKVNQGEQIYWICPLVEESENLQVKSAKQTYEHLKHNIFPDLNIGLLHGKLKPEAKLQVMQHFANGDIDILVSTSVIEVGVDVPNATIMVIEGAERFGLAQLHQIRGRVGRGDKQSWCFLFTDEDTNEQAQQRLEHFATEDNGLKIAEYDLQQRGPGEVYGTRQAGIPNLKIARLDDVEQIKHSKQLAQKLYTAGVAEIELFS